MARKKRIYEQVCSCSGYPFPHRMFGGRCAGLHICEESYPGRDCKGCLLGRNGYCEVIEGQESTMECPIVQDFMASYEIRTYNRKLK